MANGRYEKLFDQEAVLSTIADYFLSHNAKELATKSIRAVYADIVSTYHNYCLPHFSHARRILIEELQNNGLLRAGEALTTEVALRLLQLYEYEDDLSYHLKKHPGKIIADPVLPFVVQLPSQRYLEEVAKGIQQETEKKRTRKGIILSICRNIKKKHKGLVIAAIPDFNPIAEVGMTDKEYLPLNISTSICLFIKDTPKGRELVEHLKSDTENPEHDCS